MKDFTIKQTADFLGVTIQAIYKDKQDLIDKGYMLKDNLDKYVITQEGLNYLKDKRIKRLERTQKKKDTTQKRNLIKPDLNQNAKDIELIQKELEIKLLQERLNDKQGLIDKLEIDNKNMQDILSDREQKLQELFNKNTRLLETTTETEQRANKEKTELLKENERLKIELEHSKKSFWKRLFNK